MTTVGDAVKYGLIFDKGTVTITEGDAFLEHWGELKEKAGKSDEHYRAMREFQERNMRQARQIRGFKAALKHCISKTARSVELIEDDVITGDLGALNELNELVVYIAGQLNPRKEA